MNSTQPLSAPLEQTRDLRWDTASSGRLWRIELGSTVVAIGILVQATLADQIITGSHWLVTSHRIVAEFLPLLSLGLVVVAWLNRRAYRAAGAIVVALGVAMVLLIAQTGTGFVGRSAIGAIGVHIPLGVALLGLYVAIAMHARSLRLRSGSAIAQEGS